MYTWGQNTTALTMCTLLLYTISCGHLHFTDIFFNQRKKNVCTPISPKWERMGHGLMQFYAQLGLTNTVSHRLKFRNKDLSLKSEVGVFCVILQKLPLCGLCNYELKTIYLLQFLLAFCMAIQSLCSSLVPVRNAHGLLLWQNKKGKCDKFLFSNSVKTGKIKYSCWDLGLFPLSTLARAKEQVCMCRLEIILASLSWLLSHSALY